MEYVSGNIFLRPNTGMKKGQVIQGHTHNFDHTSFVTKGAVHVKGRTPEGRVFEGNFGNGYPFQHFLVKAEVSHEITALEDETDFYCVYAHRTPQGDVVQEVTGFMEAYI